MLWPMIDIVIVIISVGVCREDDLWRRILYEMTGLHGTKVGNGEQFCCWIVQLMSLLDFLIEILALTLAQRRYVGVSQWCREGQRCT